MAETRIVLGRKRAVDAAEREHLAQLQLVQQRYAVQYPPFEVVGGVERRPLVGDELQGLHQGEGVGREVEREVALRREERRQRELFRSRFL